MELYKEELLALSRILSYVEDIANQDGVFDVEIRIRVDDTEQWAVLGYGEAGDPCVLRFEDDKKWEFPKAQTTLPGITSFHHDRPLGAA